MPTYMDMHDIPGVKAADVVGAHEADLRVQGKYGVNYRSFADPPRSRRSRGRPSPLRRTARDVHKTGVRLRSTALMNR